MTASALPMNAISQNEVEQEARRDAQAGIFRNPHEPNAWVPRDPCLHAAKELYSKVYWDTFNQLRFQAGLYELL